MKKILIDPLIFASGVSLFLYSHNQNLSLGSYLAPFPFWVVVGRPLGLFWNKKVLTEINKDVFPPDLKNYKELYLVSKRALVYDVIFNHTIYNPIIAAIIIGYTYGAKKIEQRFRGQTQKTVNFIQPLKSIGWNLVQIRALISLASIISEYWISYLSLAKSSEGLLTIGTSAKRFLLMKQLLLNFGWHSYLLKKVNQAYSI